MIRVDDGRWPLGRMKMSHLIADSHEELVACAGALGLSPDYIQYPHTWKEHLDVSRSKRAEAIRLGAREITRREMALAIRERRREAAGGGR